MTNVRRFSDEVDYDSIFDPNLTIEEYTQKLDNLLREVGKNLIERKTIIRQKVQEFKEVTRARDVRNR